MGKAEVIIALVGLSLLPGAFGLALLNLARYPGPRRKRKPYRIRSKKYGS